MMLTCCGGMGLRRVAEEWDCGVEHPEVKAGFVQVQNDP